MKFNTPTDKYAALRSAILSIGIAFLLCVVGPMAMISFLAVAAGDPLQMIAVAGLTFGAFAIIWMLFYVAWAKWPE